MERTCISENVVYGSYLGTRHLHLHHAWTPNTSLHAVEGEHRLPSAYYA